VFTCTSSNDPILHRENLEPIAQQPLMLFDISVPRNIHSNVNEIDCVQAFNVDDLEAVVAQNQESRRQMALEAEALLEEECDGFMNWFNALDTVSTISSLRTKVESIREQELEKALSRLGADFSDKHRSVVEALSRGIVNKILHDPMTQLRAQPDRETRHQAMETLQVLFNLEEKSKV
ncbi:MAG: glutamyl-tRNA reductase, partial [Cyanobacteria bacterium J06626_23]